MVKMEKNKRKNIKMIWSRINKDRKKYSMPGLVMAIYLLLGILLPGGACPVYRITGFPCPGCGMTRAAVLFLHGSWEQSFHMHPLLIGVILLVLTFCVLRYLLGKEVTNLKYFVFALAAVAVVVYIYRMITMFPNEEPMIYNKNAFIYRIYQSVIVLVCCIIHL